MAIDPNSRGVVSGAHVSLLEAGDIARKRGSLSASAEAAFQLPSSTVLPKRKTAAESASAAAGSRAPKRTASPHTPVVSNSNADPDQWDGLLNRMGQKYNVPPMF